MIEMEVSLGERSYPIYIGQSLFSSLSAKRLISTQRVAVISNSTIYPLYQTQIQSWLKDFDVLPVIIDDGEQYKNLQTFEAVVGQLLSANLGRDTTLIALGGGVVGDLCGFVAACYQRGIPFIQIPTSLLAQVDSSVGGKTAVNHLLGKNMIGAFYQPKQVLIDTDMLNTLPPREFSAGMAEVIKYGILWDRDFFDWIVKHQSDILAKEPTVIQSMIQRCCEIKAEVVSKDEKEEGLRALLNLGHTFGHAIEAELGYGDWLHGEAVAAGMVYAMMIAQLRNWLPQSDVDAVKSILAVFQLPVEGPQSMRAKDYIPHMQKDKKNKEGTMRFILPTQIGRTAIFDDVRFDELQAILG
ncbi:3-dehydroquinate synthase [Algicola sagamiensis]|uniref:3-dehydroquinate synthase n=1 Tax=Algicola sagamiensis TaxID=163869 RepID=UPI0003A42695|nr:3-dehydroquinate synthase [Algicola sagamiensis]